MPKKRPSARKRVATKPKTALVSKLPSLKSWTMLPVIALVALVGYMVVNSSFASTRRSGFIDISNPQCGSFTDKLGKSSFGIVGLNGTELAFKTNQCLMKQIGRFSAYDIYVGGNYTSPECTRRRISSAYDCGKAAGRYNQDLIKFLRLKPGTVWIDVEQGNGKKKAFSSNQADHRSFLLGLFNQMKTTQRSVGYYSYQSAWNDITGGWKDKNAPHWYGSGRTNNTDALRYCKLQFGGAPNTYVQLLLYNRTLDYNLHC